MTDQFHYSGPATIDGVQFPNVDLHGDTRDWEGVTSFPASSAPAGFSANISGGPLTVELPDGRRGRALMSNVRFDGSRWTVDLTGTGPAPA